MFQKPTLLYKMLFGQLNRARTRRTRECSFRISRLTLAISIVSLLIMRFGAALSPSPPDNEDRMEKVIAAMQQRPEQHQKAYSDKSRYEYRDKYKAKRYKSTTDHRQSIPQVKTRRSKKKRKSQNHYNTKSWKHNSTRKIKHTPTDIVADVGVITSNRTTDYSIKTLPPTLSSSPTTKDNLQNTSSSSWQSSLENFTSHYHGLTMTTPWVRRFLASRPQDHLLPIPRDYLSDGFNFHRIQYAIDHLISNFNAKMNETQRLPDPSWRKISSLVYRESLRRILLTESQQENKDDLYTKLGLPESLIEKCSQILFTLVHARFVTSPRGMDMVRRMMMMYVEDDDTTDSSKNQISIKPIFGSCPRISCVAAPLLPCGLSDEYNHTSDSVDMFPFRALRYCCKCGETFYFHESKVDGSAWGVSFCHLFLLTYGDPWKAFDNRSTQALRYPKNHDPKVFRFRLHPRSSYPFPSKHL